MKCVLLYVGATERGYLAEGVDLFVGRLKHYLPVEELAVREEKAWKKLGPEDRKAAEARAVLAKLRPGDEAVLLDEGGKSYSSAGFATFLQKRMNRGCKRLVFVTAGAYGAHAELKSAVPVKLSLSDMTFSHQMVRLFLTEQLYRAMTILKNEPYHNP